MYILSWLARRLLVVYHTVYTKFLKFKIQIWFSLFGKSIEYSTEANKCQKEPSSFIFCMPAAHRNYISAAKMNGIFLCDIRIFSFTGYNVEPESWLWDVKTSISIAV